MPPFKFFLNILLKHILLKPYNMDIITVCGGNFYVYYNGGT